MHHGLLSIARGCAQLEAELVTVKAELATRAAAGDGQAVLAAAKEQELLHEHDMAVRHTQHHSLRSAHTCWASSAGYLQLSLLLLLLLVVVVVLVWVVLAVVLVLLFWSWCLILLTLLYS